MSPEHIRQQWLAGTTCAGKKPDVREVLFANRTHIVLKHRSHSEWVDRGSGSGTCTSFARLYLRSALLDGLSDTGGYSVKPIKEWTGRISLRRVREECASLGVNFKD